MKLKFFVLYFIIIYVQTYALAQVSIGVDGLTCSMCSNSIYRSLLQAKGVKEIKMDLNENIAEIYFHQNAVPNFTELSQKVRDAGYSVRFIKVKIYFEEFNAGFGKAYHFEGNEYIYVGNKKDYLNEPSDVMLIGKEFASKKEFKKWASIIRDFENQQRANTYFFVF